MGRPSRIYGWVAKNGTVTIQGDVAFFASGILSLGVLQHLAREAKREECDERGLGKGVAKTRASPCLALACLSWGFPGM